MSQIHNLDAAQVRERLGHPIIDADGHFLELGPVFYDTLKEVAGPEVTASFERLGGTPMTGIQGGRAPSREQRQQTRQWVTPWWVPTAETRDWASASAPGLLYERLPEIGLDFAVLFPTYSFSFIHSPEPEIRQVGCRAFNRHVAELFKLYRDRLEPAAMLPMGTPAEALDELDHIASLGLKVAMFPGYQARPIPAVAEKYPELARQVTWLDAYGVDSAHDYDPVWERCVALGLPLAAHSHAMGWPDRASVTNYMFNHMGHFAAAGDLLCKSLFLGGVTKRFPGLRVAMLEGGVASACRLYADLFARWEKRGSHVIDRLDPERLDADEAIRLVEHYGAITTDDQRKSLRDLITRPQPVDADLLDCFAPLDLEREEDIRDLFVDNFFFGCEADDPLTSWAFRTDVNPLGATLRAIMGSDIGHWDVVHFTDPVPECYEMLEKGLLDADALRAFTFDHPVAFLAGANPDFFRGTALEAVLAGPGAPP